VILSGRRSQKGRGNRAICAVRGSAPRARTEVLQLYISGHMHGLDVGQLTQIVFLAPDGEVTTPNAQQPRRKSDSQQVPKKEPAPRGPNVLRNRSKAII
jgi:hypothetical protein